LPSADAKASVDDRLMIIRIELRAAVGRLPPAMSGFDVVDGARSRHRSAIGWFVETNHIRGAVHMQITTIGLDIAKNVFQIHGINAAEKVIVRKQLRRGQVMALLPIPKLLAASASRRNRRRWQRLRAECARRWCACHLRFTATAIMA
jgi:hypothetical protein